MLVIFNKSEKKIFEYNKIYILFIDKWYNKSKFFFFSKVFMLKKKNCKIAKNI